MNLRAHTAVLLTSILLAGCGSLTQILSGNASRQDLTGNWQFTPLNDQAGTPVISLFTGALASSGSSVTGTFRLDANTCGVPITRDIVFTGSEDQSSVATLTSTTLPNNPMTLAFTASSPATGVIGSLGSLTIGGTGPCALPKTTFGGLFFQPVTGNYAGTLISTDGTAATVSAQLTQAVADGDGQFPESGTVTLTTSACTSTFSVTGLVTGPTFSASLNSTTAGLPGTALVLGAITPDGTQISLPGGIDIASANCNRGAFSGTLTRR